MSSMNWTTPYGREFPKRTWPLADMWELPEEVSELTTPGLFSELEWTRSYQEISRAYQDFIQVQYRFTDTYFGRPVVYAESTLGSDGGMSFRFDHRYSIYNLDISRAKTPTSTRELISKFVERKVSLEEKLESKWGAGRLAERYLIYSACFQIRLSKIEDCSPLILDLLRDKGVWHGAIHLTPDWLVNIALAQSTSDMGEFKELKSLPTDWLTRLA